MEAVLHCAGRLLLLSCLFLYLDYLIINATVISQAFLKLFGRRNSLSHQCLRFGAELCTPEELLEFDDEEACCWPPEDVPELLLEDEPF